MPSCPVHLKVACMLCDKLGVYDKAGFMLGAVAPDCVNLKGFASKEIRYGAHIRSADYEVWKKQLRDFYNENKMKYVNNLDFVKGYIFHCLTDIAWDEVVQPELFEYLDSNGKLSREEMTKQKWEELFRFNGMLVNEDWYYGAILLMKSGRAEDIATVTKQMINDYRDYVAEDYKDKVFTDKPQFLGQKHIDLAAKRTLELYKSVIS